MENFKARLSSSRDFQIRFGTGVVWGILFFVYLVFNFHWTTVARNNKLWLLDITNKNDDRVYPQVAVCPSWNMTTRHVNSLSCKWTGFNTQTAQENYNRNHNWKPTMSVAPPTQFTDEQGQHFTCPVVNKGSPFKITQKDYYKWPEGLLVECTSTDEVVMGFWKTNEQPPIGAWQLYQTAPRGRFVVIGLQTSKLTWSSGKNSPTFYQSQELPGAKIPAKRGNPLANDISFFIMFDGLFTMDYVELNMYNFWIMMGVCGGASLVFYACYLLFVFSLRKILGVSPDSEGDSTSYGDNSNNNNVRSGDSYQQKSNENYGL